VTRRTANWQHILRGHVYRDIRAWLSNINLVLAGVFMLAILVLGPTLFVMRDFVQNIGVYFREVLPLTFSTSAFEGAKGTAWQGSWTMFYWGWWMSWAPFVGVFIARISRGRTIREFVAGVLLVPTLVTFRALRDEHKVQLRAERRQRREQLAREVGDDVTHELTGNFDEHFGVPVERMLRRCSAPAPVLPGLAGRPEAERNSPPRTARPALEGLCGAGSDARSRAWTTLVPCRHPGQDAQGSTAGVRSIRPRTRSQRQCSWSAKQWLGSGQTRRPLRMWTRPTS